MTGAQNTNHVTNWFHLHRNFPANCQTDILFIRPYTNVRIFMVILYRRYDILPVTLFRSFFANCLPKNDTNVFSSLFWSLELCPRWELNSSFRKFYKSRNIPWPQLQTYTAFSWHYSWQQGNVLTISVGKQFCIAGRRKWGRERGPNSFASCRFGAAVFPIRELFVLLPRHRKSHIVSFMCQDSSGLINYWPMLL